MLSQTAANLPARQLLRSPGELTRRQSPHSPQLIWENFRATERLLRATKPPIFLQSLPWREWYIFNFSASPLVYL